MADHCASVGVVILPLNDQQRKTVVELMDIELLPWIEKVQSARCVRMEGKQP